MGSGTLPTYMQDHLAGSSGGVSLIGRLVAGSESEAERRELREIETEILADKETLLSLMEKVGSRPSRIKNLGSLIGDKLSRPKLRSGSGDGRILKLEAMIMGVTGKRRLWTSLMTLADAGDTRFDRTQIEELAARADDQIARLKSVHESTATRVLRD